MTDYGYRYLNVLTGRWSSKDPIEESGGINLYGFVGNDGVGRVDFLGRRIAAVIIPMPSEIVSGSQIGDTVELNNSSPLGQANAALGLVRDIDRSVMLKRHEFNDAVAELNRLTVSEWDREWIFQIDVGSFEEDRQVTLVEAKELVRRELKSSASVRYVDSGSYNHFFSNVGNMSGIGVDSNEDYDQKWVVVHGENSNQMVLSDGSVVARPAIEMLFGFGMASCHLKNQGLARINAIAGSVTVDKECNTVKLKPFRLKTTYENPIFDPFAE